MFRYIFWKTELMSLFYLEEHGDFECDLFKVSELTQEEFDEAIENLIAKNIVYRINNSEVKIDKMFSALINSIVSAEYIINQKNLVLAVNEIVIVLEEDSRNKQIIKMIPYKSIDDAIEEYGLDIMMN